MRYSPKPPVLSPVQPTLRALVKRSPTSLTFGTRGWMNWLLIMLAVCGSPYSCASWFSSSMTLISSFHWLSMISRAGRTAHTSSVPGLCKCYILLVKYKMDRFWMLIGECSVPAPFWNLIAPTGPSQIHVREARESPHVRKSVSSVPFGTGLI